MMDNESKKILVSFIKAHLTGDFMSEEDIAWIMEECEKGNKPTYDDFVKARRPEKVKPIEPDGIRCHNCKYFHLTFADDPCKDCLKQYADQSKGFKHKHFEKKEKEVNCLNCKNVDTKSDEEPCRTCIKIGNHELFEEKETVVHKDNSPIFGPNMMREEEFKIPDSIQIMIDQNKKPNLVIPQLDDIKKKIIDFAKVERAEYDALTSNLNCIQSTANTIKSHQINLEKVNHAIEEKIDKLTEALESVNSKLDILDQRMHDLGQHQILKDTKCVIQVKNTPERPEPKFKVNDEVEIVTDVFKIKYTIETIYWSNGPVSDRGYWYVLASPSDKTRRHVQEDLLIPFNSVPVCFNGQEDKDIPSIAKEPPKFKVGDIVKVTNDSRNNDFFICRIKWSEHSKTWNYLISLDLEDISGAFWRTEKWLTKSENDSEPLFKVGDKVRLKHGEVVYEVYSIIHFIHNNKKIYRYKIGYSASTTHYENENRLVKA